MTLSKEEVDATLLLQNQICSLKEWTFDIRSSLLSLNYSSDGVASHYFSLASVESNISLCPSIELRETESISASDEHEFIYFDTFLQRSVLRLKFPPQFITSLKSSLESKTFDSCKLQIEPSEKHIGLHRLRFKGQISFIFMYE